MRCPLCRNLELAYQSRRDEFLQASSLAYLSVSKRFAAYSNVELERALSELLDHRSVCLSAENQSGLNQSGLLSGAPKLAPPETFTPGAVGTAA
jgi:hypothetical protein